MYDHHVRLSPMNRFRIFLKFIYELIGVQNDLEFIFVYNPQYTLAKFKQTLFFFYASDIFRFKRLFLKLSFSCRSLLLQSVFYPISSSINPLYIYVFPKLSYPQPNFEICNNAQSSSSFLNNSSSFHLWSVFHNFRVASSFFLPSLSSRCSVWISSGLFLDLILGWVLDLLPRFLVGFRLSCTCYC